LGFSGCIFLLCRFERNGPSVSYQFALQCLYHIAFVILVAINMIITIFSRPVCVWVCGRGGVGACARVCGCGCGCVGVWVWGCVCVSVCCVCGGGVGVGACARVCGCWCGCVGGVVGVRVCVCVCVSMCCVCGTVLEKNKLHGLSPRVNYTDRATAACRRSDCQLLRIEGATWSA
jgi:hypothetical protein